MPCRVAVVASSPSHYFHSRAQQRWPRSSAQLLVSIDLETVAPAPGCPLAKLAAATTQGPAYRAHSLGLLEREGYEIKRQRAALSCEARG